MIKLLDEYGLKAANLSCDKTTTTGSEMTACALQAQELGCLIAVKISTFSPPESTISHFAWYKISVRPVAQT
jgi:hypothetical protein